MGYYYVTRPQTPKITKNTTMNAYPPTFYCHALEDQLYGKMGIGTLGQYKHNVYVRWLSPLVLCINGTMIMTHNDPAQQFIDASLHNSEEEQ
jgi:hypothetical protein